MPGNQSKDMRDVRGRAEAIRVLSYQLYELDINLSQTENASRFMDEGNFYVKHEMWKFLSVRNQKIIKSLKFCIMRTWLNISTTCFACCPSFLLNLILYLCLLCFFNTFYKAESIHLTKTKEVLFLHTGDSKI